MRSLLRILYLEDNPNDAQRVRSAIEAAALDCRISLVDNRADFVGAVEKEEFDIILAVQTLDGFDGISALEIARHKNPDVPFIFVSEQPGIESALVMLKTGATDYICKPELSRLVPAILRAADEKKEKKELREAEKRYRMLAESSQDFIFIIDQRGFLKYINRSGAEFMRQDQDKVPGMHLSNIFDENTCRQFWNGLQKVFRTGEASINESLIELPAARFWLHTQLVPFFKKNKKVEQVMGIARDISQIRKAADTLRDSEDRLRILFERAPDAYYLTDLNGDFADGNLAAERMLGGRREELIGKNYLSLGLLGKRDAFRAKRNLVKNKKGMSTGPDEFTLNTWNGKQVVVEIRTHPVKIKDEDLVLGIARDITDRKETENRLQWELAIAGASNELSETTVHSSSTISDIANILLEHALMFTDSKHGFVSVTSPETGENTILAQTIISGGNSGPRPGNIQAMGNANPLNACRVLDGELLSPENPYFMNAPQNQFLDLDLPEKHARIHNLLSVPALADGRKVGQVVVINSDKDYSQQDIHTLQRLTELYAVAIRKKQAKIALQKSEEQHRLLFETMVQGVVYQDRAGQIIFANPAAERILGLTLDQMKGRTSHDPRWKAVREDGSEFPGDQHPAIMALRTGKEIKNAIMGIFNPHENELRWIIVHAVPQFKPGEDTPYQVYTTIEDFTARKKAAEALQESEEKYRTLFENLQDVFFRTNSRGIITLVSPSIENILGYKPDEITGMDLNRELFIHEEERNRFTGLVSKQGFVERFEFALRRKDGSAVFVSTSAHFYRDREGKVAGIEGLCRDISQRKKATRALRESEERYRTLFDRVPVGLYRTDGKGNVLEANQALIEIFGYQDREEIFASSAVSHYLDPGERGKWKKAIDANGFVKDYVTQHVRKDGKVIWLKENATAIKDEKGNLQFYEGSLEDVTEKQLAERALRESEERFRNLFENAVIGIYRTTPDGKIQLANPALLRMMGYNSFEDLAKRNLEESGFEPDHPRDEFKKRLEAEGQIIGMEAAWRRNDGTVLHISESAKAIKDDAGEIIYYEGTVEDITQRKLAESALTESEKKYRHLFENLQDVFYRADMKGDLVLISPSCKEIFGYTPDEIIGLNLAKDFYVDPPEQHEILNHMTEKGTVHNFEVRLKKKDGKIIWGSSNSEILYDETGKPVGVQGLVRDITDRKNMETALQDSENLFRTMTEFALVGVYIIQDGKFVYVNSSLAETFGYQPDEIIGKLGPLDLTDPADQETVREHIADRPEKGIEFIRYVAKGRHRKEVEIYFEVMGRTIDYHGKPAILGTLIDITGRRKTQQTLSESEARFRSLVQHSSDIITIMDLEGIIHYQSDTMEKMAGYKPEELIGECAFHYIPVDELPHIKEVIQDIAENKQVSFMVEHHFRHKDGSWRIFESTTSNQLHNPAVAGIVINSRDITERRTLEDQLIQAQKMEAVGRLAGGVAHDFNNLLTVINGYTEMLLYKMEKDDPRISMAEMIQKAGNKANSLVSQLLAFSRRQIIRPEILDLNSSLKDMIKMLRRLIGEDIELVTHLGPNLHRIKADPGQIDQVVMNLAVNARDAMPNGGRFIIETKNVSSSNGDLIPNVNNKNGEYVLLSITDTGTGMDEETLSHVFEPFFTTKEKGKGTGLGLATIYGIVKSHDGILDVSSQPGEGTTFKIYLPMASGQPLASKSSDKKPERANGNESILVVEDEEAVRELISDILEDHGFEVRIAKNGTEALDIFQQQDTNYDLLVTDLIMPRINGKELSLKARKISPNLRILFISGYNDEEVGNHGISETEDDYLQKPFSPESLVSKIRMILDRNKPHKEALVDMH